MEILITKSLKVTENQISGRDIVLDASQFPATTVTLHNFLYLT